MAAQQMNLPRRGAGYPQRPPFFFHRFTRLLGKVCAAQHVGPEGAWFLTYMASTEDSAKYRHAVAWTDAQLSPLVGMSPSTLKRVRGKCLEHGWLHYEQGYKGVPSLYWVTVPPAYDICDGQYLDDELAKSLRIRGQIELESGSQPDRIRTECELESGSQPATSIPTPATTSTTVPSTPDGGGEFGKVRRTSSPSLGDHSAPHAASSLSELHPDAEQLAELQTRLSAIGVDLAEKTLLAALSAGHSVSSINGIISHAEQRPDWWGGGAVRLRLTRLDSVPLPVERGWPQPNAAAKSRWESQRRRDAEAAKLAALNEPEEPKEKEQMRWDWEALEREFGQQIDSASIDELSELFDEGFPRNYFRHAALKDSKYRQIKHVRRDLLRKFSAKKGT